MAIAINRIGEFNGLPVDEAVLESASGVRVAIMNWGVVVRDWQVPVAGVRRVTWRWVSKASIPIPSTRPISAPWSAAWPIASRMPASRSTARPITLVPSEGPNQLHGGPEGLGRQVWEMEKDEAANALIFTHTSPDGAMGYPGTVHFEVKYILERQPPAARIRRHAGRADTDQHGPAPVFQPRHNRHRARSCRSYARIRGADPQWLGSGADRYHRADCRDDQRFPDAALHALRQRPRHRLRHEFRAGDRP